MYSSFFFHSFFSSYRIPGRGCSQAGPVYGWFPKRRYSSAHATCTALNAGKGGGRGSGGRGWGWGVGGRGSEVGNGQACARHRRKQRRAAHVIVVPLQVLHDSVGPIGVHSENLGRLLDREKPHIEVRDLLLDVPLLVRGQLDPSYGPHRAGRLRSDATGRLSRDATRPHERPS